MTKIVYNADFGGFSLSHDGMLRYAELKGITLYPEKDEQFGFTTYWTVPPEQRGEEEFIDDNALSTRNFDRADPILAQVVEELGPKANGRHANLQIRELRPGTKYRIDEYDGMEAVVTIDEYEWSVA